MDWFASQGIFKGDTSYLTEKLNIGYQKKENTKVEEFSYETS